VPSNTERQSRDHYFDDQDRTNAEFFMEAMGNLEEVAIDLGLAACGHLKIAEKG
jgi:hypothetical protein